MESQPSRAACRLPDDPAIARMAAARWRPMLRADEAGAAPVSSPYGVSGSSPLPVQWPVKLKQALISSQETAPGSGSVSTF